jgi:DNA recombination protein RmuC
MDVVAISMLLLGALVGAVLVKLFAPRSGISNGEFEATKTELITVKTKLAAIEAQAETLKLDLEASRNELQAVRERAVVLQTEKSSLEKRIEQHKVDIDEMQKKLHLQFENLANRIFDEKTATFKTQSQENLGQLLNPLKDKLTEFQKKVDDSFGVQAREQSSLKTHIEQIAKANEQMTVQAKNLTDALKGDVKAQGNWGEILLEKILEESGLRKGTDYIVQGKDFGLKHPETGMPLKPDVIIKLPEDKHVIVDSKVSLKHYADYCAEPDETQRAVFLKQHLNSIKTHVDGLEKRRYQDTDNMGTPDFVLMFMPVEGAYALAIQNDSTLHGYAWNKRVVLVCPSTLFATLRTIASIWRLELQNQNATEIAKRSGDLYDKFVGFVEDLQRLGNQMKTAQNTYESAMNKLSTGKGNIVARTENLKELGAKTSKALPKDLVSSEDEEDSTKLVENLN